MRELDASGFDAAVAGGPVVVDFWAPWCRPCRALETVLGELEGESRGDLVFAKLNIDEHPEIGSRYEVLSIPRVMVFAAGEVLGTLVGARPRPHVERWLAEVLPAGEVEGFAAQGQSDA